MEVQVGDQLEMKKRGRWYFVTVVEITEEKVRVEYQSEPCTAWVLKAKVSKKFAPLGTHLDICELKNLKE